MNYEAMYWNLVPGYTAYLATKKAKYFVATGSSASELVKDVESTAKKMDIKLPTVYSLSREESHKMYSNRKAQPIRVLRAILDIEKKNDLFSHQVNFIEDYTINGSKSLTLDERLVNDPFRQGEVFFYHIMVAATDILRRNIYTHSIDYELADYLDHKFNRQEYQFDE